MAENIFDGGTKTPSLSWKDCPVGTVFTLEVLEPPKLLQSRDFDTGEPAFWDPQKTQPKQSAVVNVKVISGPHSIGEERSVWAQKPSSLFQAIAAAQSSSGALIQQGGTLHLRLHSEKPHENKRFNAIKIYEARYAPPHAFSAPNAFPKPQAPPVTSQPPPVQPVVNPSMVGWGNAQGAVTPPPVTPTW